MNKNSISCQVNDLFEAPKAALCDFINEETVRRVYDFHRSLPDYSPTPLVRLPGLAGYLGIKELWIKDENHRFDLKAFKVLGASYAMAKCLGEVIGLGDENVTFQNIVARKSAYGHLTFVTATDGNHGRAVAWAAKQFGCSAVVYMPEGSSPVRLEAIRQYGAEASVAGLNYDECVIHAERKARENGWVLLQDTSWEGYSHFQFSSRDSHPGKRLVSIFPHVSLCKGLYRFIRRAAVYMLYPVFFKKCIGKIFRNAVQCAPANGKEYYLSAFCVKNSCAFHY